MRLCVLYCSLTHAAQFIESINSGGAKDYESCEKAIEAYREIFTMEVASLRVVSCRVVSCRVGRLMPFPGELLWRRESCDAAVHE